MVFVNEKPAGKPEEWRTIDYERDAILKSLGGLPHGGGSWFNLSWKGENVHFGAYSSLNGYIDPNDKDKGLRKLFKIFQIKIPEALKPDKDELLDLISEALSEYRERYQHYNIVEVRVDFSQCRYYRT